MAIVRTARFRFPVLRLLVGRFRPSGITITGLRLSLLRDAHGRENWRNQDDGEGDGGSPLNLRRLRITDARILYRDGKNDRRFLVRAAADTRSVRLNGTGFVQGVPVRVRAQGAPVRGSTAWPFYATLDGDVVAITMKGVMDRPLDPQHMTAVVHARARDLKLIDAVIEVGLFGTQPVDLTARVRHDPDRWALTDLKGRIGRSSLSGQITAQKTDERTRLNGAIASDGLDFDDLASDAGRAQAAAVEREQGLKLVPATRINLASLDNIDGRLVVDIRRVLPGRRPTAIRSIKGVMVLDRSHVVATDLVAALDQGRITGTVTVDQRGRPHPLVGLDLRLTGSSVDAIAGGNGRVTGDVSGRVLLAGVGDTIRAAVGASSGRLGLVARDGGLPTDVARALGFDLGAVFASGDDRARLRCVVAGFAVAHGTGTATTFVVDTSESQLVGEGTLSFPSESLNLTLSGHAKAGLLHLPGTAFMTGTIREPNVVVPPGIKSIGNIITALGREITGANGTSATDADCGALAARVLR